MNSHSVANGSLNTWTWTLGAMSTYAVVVHAVVTHHFVCSASYQACGLQISPENRNFRQPCETQENVVFKRDNVSSFANRLVEH
jgi:hypothetical protein